MWSNGETLLAVAQGGGGGGGGGGGHNTKASEHPKVATTNAAGTHFTIGQLSWVTLIMGDSTRLCSGLSVAVISLAF